MIQVHHASYETLFSEKRRGVGWPSGRGVVSTGPGPTPGTKMSEMVGTVKGRKTSSQRKCVGEAQGHGRAGVGGGHRRADVQEPQAAGEPVQTVQQHRLEDEGPGPGQLHLQQPRQGKCRDV